MRNIFLKERKRVEKSNKKGGSIARKEKMVKGITSVKKANEIIKLRDDLRKEFKNATLRNIYIEEEKEKSFGPVTNELKNVVNAVNEVKEINIKTDEDIQKVLVPLRRPDILRLADPIKPTLDAKSPMNDPQLLKLMDTPKRPPMNETPKSPMPKDAIILGENAKKYLSDLEKNNQFGIYYNTDI